MISSVAEEGCLLCLGKEEGREEEGRERGWEEGMGQREDGRRAFYLRINLRIFVRGKWSPRNWRYRNSSGVKLSGLRDAEK